MSCAQKPFKVVRGENQVLTIWLESETTNEPMDLTGAAITAKFPKDDGTVLEKTVGSGVDIVSEKGGKFTVTLSDTDTASLKVGEYQDFECIITISGNVTIPQFRKLLSVFSKVFT